LSTPDDFADMAGGYAWELWRGLCQTVVETASDATGSIAKTRSR
jgi:hypothetical protein